MTQKAFVRFTESLGKALDKWRHDQMDTPSRADVIRRLFGKALKEEGYTLHLYSQETMTRPTARARHISHAEAGCIEFDDALETYLEGGDAEELLRASALVVGCTIPLDEERAEIITVLTACACVPVDYDDAGRAVRRWFGMMAEPGARH